jgi:hypothetical protein
MGSYAVGSSTRWRNSTSTPSSAVALAAIVNLPEEFVSRSPYLVVAQTDWILWCARVPHRTRTFANAPKAGTCS